VSETGTRRDFLTALGAGVTASALGGCTRAPAQNAIPFLVQPEEVTPGVATWYATTCGGCPSACGLLVKTRDGRPIKVEGNPDSTLTGGGTCAVGQATVLSLYDEARLRGPLWGGQPASWEEIDGEIETRLAAAADRGAVVLLSGPVVSPTLRRLIDDWRGRLPRFRHVVHEPLSLAAIRRASGVCFGRPGLPHYRLDRARVIVGLDADFLGSWLSPVEFTRDYARARRSSAPSAALRHIQLEPGLSLTGANADRRAAVAPSDLGLAAVTLLARTAARLGLAGVTDLPAGRWDPEVVESAAADLWAHRGESLVLCGVRDLDAQIVVSALNGLLGNLGTTLDLGRPSFQSQADDAAVADLVAAMGRGEIHALIVHGVNPAYDLPRADAFLGGLDRVALTVSLAGRLDETASRVQAVCPDHHFLESWGDAEPVAGHLSLVQPTIAPLFDTRAALDSLLRWSGAETDGYRYLREHWRRAVFPRQRAYRDFDEFWDRTLERGVLDLPVLRPGDDEPPAPRLRGDWRAAARRIVEAHRRSSDGRAGRSEVHLHASVAVRDGRHADNPWLLELPDPVTKVTWGNVAALSPAHAARLGVADGDVLAIEAEGAPRLELPALVQPGQASETVSIAVGYGRRAGGKAGVDVGVNVYPLLAASTFAHLVKTGRRAALARTQTQASLEGRPLFHETTGAALVDVASDPSPSRPPRSLYPDRARGEHRWGMAVDLDACTGCSACVVACQAENNVPVVGPDEVRRGREMHWIRIDRYYTGPEGATRVDFQPMMCQHCGNAPCEPVCPVLATLHSSDGLNQQVYNRCIGTRYCANNCPYKVRRFNWFDYAGGDRPGLGLRRALPVMVLNPDVTVRSRGVMEKCSLCVQRIQAGRLRARQEGREVRDGDIQTACQQACPAQAIVFGDLADPASRVAQWSRSARAFRVLDDLGTRPAVAYLSRVRRTGEKT
jgi:molybdopterin-containing oxidoreductase family iron-sulfur binding subunit